VRDHCEGKLAPYKIPKQVEVVDELPKTPSGKLHRAALRE
jgi:acyl-coenzyme A synthetase/AMP-(fatty) acid ligase